MVHVAARAPEGWRESHLSEASVPEDPGFESLGDGEEVTVNARKRPWARLLTKVYEIGPLEIRDILAHLVKTGRAPPGFDPTLMN